MTDDEITELLDIVDKDADGMVDYIELIKVIVYSWIYRVDKGKYIVEYIELIKASILLII